MEKKYALPPEIEQEIQKLLRPETDDSPIQVELWFGQTLDKDKPPPLPPDDLKPLIHKTRQTSREIWFCVQYPASEVQAIHRTYEKIAVWPLREVRLNGYRIPYVESLWLPLLFFYIAEHHNTSS